MKIRRVKAKIKHKKTVTRNPVAKHAAKFNRSAKYKDRKKALKGGEVKHRRKKIE